MGDQVLRESALSGAESDAALPAEAAAETRKGQLVGVAGLEPATSSV
jgi:hypothetical protein